MIIQNKILFFYEFNSNILRNINIIRGDFAEVAKTWSLPIDILHIDGFHEYESVKSDYVAWSPFVKENGIILIHDICNGRFGCNRVFTEATHNYKLFYPDFGGLGILTHSEDIYNKVLKEFTDLKIGVFV